jgi:hypothetical protein
MSSLVNTMSMVLLAAEKVNLDSRCLWLSILIKTEISMVKIWFMRDFTFFKDSLSHNLLSLGGKHQTRIKVANRDKRSSLLCCDFNS